MRGVKKNTSETYSHKGRPKRIFWMFNQPSSSIESYIVQLQWNNLWIKDTLGTINFSLFKLIVLYREGFLKFMGPQAVSFVERLIYYTVRAHYIIPKVLRNNWVQLKPIFCPICIFYTYSDYHALHYVASMQYIFSCVCVVCKSV